MAFPIHQAELATLRLKLTPLTRTHAPAMWNVLCDPISYRWIPGDAPVSPDALVRRFTALERGFSSDGGEQWLNWAASAKETGESVGLFEMTVRPDQTASVAYFVRPSLWRRGFGKEGLTAVVMHAMSEGVSQIVAEMDVRNVASQKLVSSVGFQLIEVRKAVEFFKDSWSDEAIWQLEAP